jgi:3-oxoacyl-[acyl-carrier protein] reductase
MRRNEILKMAIVREETEEEIKMNLRGKTAVVTGGSRGIGRAFALRLAEEGLNLIVNFRSREKEAEEVVSMIRKKGGRALAVGADVSVLAEVEKLVRIAHDAFGPIQVLVNNAAIHRGARIHKLMPEDWDVVIRSSLYGAYNCCHLIVPDMIGQGWGRIINISSPVAERGYPGDGAYSAAKAGLIGLTKSLARELGQDGVTVNAVLPGFVLTEMTGSLTEKNLAAIRAGIPLGRPCEAHEVAEVVAFLVVKGDHITGSVYNVDGGIGI